MKNIYQDEEKFSGKIFFWQTPRKPSWKRRHTLAFFLPVKDILKVTAYWLLVLKWSRYHYYNLIQQSVNSGSAEIQTCSRHVKDLRW